MSTESRLARLGLFHLKDNPEALDRRLEELLIEIEAEKIRLRSTTSKPGSEDRQRASKNQEDPS
jgi:hypothetical protein